MLPAIRSILGHSKILVLTLSFFSLILVSAYFAGHAEFGDTDQSVKGIETVNTRTIPATPTPQPAKHTYQWQPVVVQKTTPIEKYITPPTPTPIPDQPSVDQSVLEEMQEPTPSQSQTTTTKLTCTFSNGTFLCQ